MQGTNSTIKTTLLLGALTGLFLVIGSAIGGTGGMMIAFILAVALNMGAWWFSGKIALAMSGAKEVSPEMHLNCIGLSNACRYAPKFPGRVST